MLIFLIIYVVGFFCIPTIVTYLDIKFSGSMYNPEDSLIWIGLAWPITIFIIPIFLLQWVLRNKR